MIFIYLTLAFWGLMSIYWIMKANTNSQTKFSFEISSMSKLILSALIIYLPLLISGWFAKELYTTNDWTNVIGVIFCGFGILFAIWSRNVLGRNWSGKVMIQNKHSLITSGPYGLVRHPQYTGFLSALFGTALVFGQIFGFIWCIFLMFGLIIKAKQEEKILVNEFSKEYPEYKKKVKMIIPYIF
jgi:protein-S-isoprenylcysteine O-methyltransferase Ste14